MSIIGKLHDKWKRKRELKGVGKPVIMTQWGPVTESARLRAALNMREDANKRLQVETLLANQLFAGNLVRGREESRKRYGEAYPGPRRNLLTIHLTLQGGPEVLVLCQHDLDRLRGGHQLITGARTVMVVFTQDQARMASKINDELLRGPITPERFDALMRDVTKETADARQNRQQGNSGGPRAVDAKSTGVQGDRGAGQGGSAGGDSGAKGSAADGQAGAGANDPGVA